MTCEQIRDNLIDLVYGELDDAGRISVEGHLESCPACRAELAQLRAARAGLAAHRGGEPAAMPDRLTPAAEPGADVARRSGQRRWGAIAAAIAALLVIALSLWLWPA